MIPNVLIIVVLTFVQVFKMQTIFFYHFCYIFIHKILFAKSDIIPIFKCIATLILYVKHRQITFLFHSRNQTFLQKGISYYMKPRFQSQQFPAHMSHYYQQKQIQEVTLQIVNEDTTDSVFHKKVFSICDIMGNFGDGFILVHFQGYIYLVDQHAASEKSLFLQYMINPTQKYSANVSFTTHLPNYLRRVLHQKDQLIRNEGWQFKELKKKALYIELQITKAPLVYNKELQQEDFSFLIEKLYNEKIDEDTSYSINQRSAMATFACRNAYKVGDRLKASQMRGLLDSLYKMDAPFNCPHGRPTIASLGRVIEVKKNICFQKQYKL